MLNVPKELLLSTLRKCLPGVEKGGSLIEGADTIVFGGNYAHSFNDRIAVSAPIVGVEGGNLEGAIKAMDLFKLVSKVPALFLQVEIKDNAWHIVAGKLKAKISLIHTTTTERIAAMGLDGLAWAALPENFAEGVALCTLKTNTPFRGIYVNGTDMISTDNMRMCLFGLAAPMPPIWVDAPAIAELFKLTAKATEFHAERGGEWVHFKLTDGTIFSSKRKPEDQFPALSIRSTVQTLAGHEGGIRGHLPAGLAEVVDRVSTLASDIGGQVPIRLILGKETLEIHAEKATGSVSETIAWETPFEADPNVEIWVESSFLAEAAPKAMEFKITPPQGDDIPGSIVFFAENYTQAAATASKAS